jgi:hypothetical protein
MFAIGDTISVRIGERFLGDGTIEQKVSGYYQVWFKDETVGWYHRSCIHPYHQLELGE